MSMHCEKLLLGDDGEDFLSRKPIFESLWT